MNNTYAEFLLDVAAQLIEEDRIKEAQGACCYICTTLNNPYPSDIIPSLSAWKERNAIYIDMLMTAINDKLDRYHRENMRLYKELYPGAVPNRISTLTFVLSTKYPDTSPLQRRVLWLQDLAKYHKVRGTSRTFRETRSWLKVVK